MPLFLLRSWLHEYYSLLTLNVLRYTLIHDRHSKVIVQHALFLQVFINSLSIYRCIDDDDDIYDDDIPMCYCFLIHFQ